MLQAYITKEIIIRTERLKKGGEGRARKSDSAPALNSPGTRGEEERSLGTNTGELERSTSAGDVHLAIQDHP